MISRCKINNYDHNAQYPADFNVFSPKMAFYPASDANTSKAFTKHAYAIPPKLNEAVHFAWLLCFVTIIS